MIKVAIVLFACDTHYHVPFIDNVKQLEQNLKFDFSMTLENGKQLESLFGPGYTGIKNLGNR